MQRLLTKNGFLNHTAVRELKVFALNTQLPTERWQLNNLGRTLRTMRIEVDRAKFPARVDARAQLATRTHLRNLLTRLISMVDAAVGREPIEGTASYEFNGRAVRNHAIREAATLRWYKEQCQPELAKQESLDMLAQQGWRIKR